MNEGSENGDLRRKLKNMKAASQNTKDLLYKLILRWVYRGDLLFYQVAYNLHDLLPVMELY